jgi:hypothetical protein
MPHRGVSCHLLDAVVPSFFKNLLQKAPPAPRNTAQAKMSQESTRPPLWEMLPAPNRRRLSQRVARVMAQHRLLAQQEVPHD